MALRTYEAYIRSMARTPVDEWRENTQEMINDTWEDTSTIETISGQKSVGLLQFENEEIQLNSVIDPKTGKSFGDDYRKIIYKNLIQNYLPPQEGDNSTEVSKRFLGKYYNFAENYWLTINTNTVIGANATAILRRCNNTLKWIDEAGVVRSWPCVFDRNLSGTNFDYGSQGVAQIGADALIMVQRNAETDAIRVNQRFLFDGHSFQIKQINNHESKTYMEIYIFETPIESKDDLEDNLANGIETISPETNGNIILPAIARILENEVVNFSVYNYVNGATTTDTFIITFSGPVENENYSITNLTGNSFILTNLKASDIPLSISCINQASGEETTKEIMLVGEW